MCLFTSSRSTDGLEPHYQSMGSTLNHQNHKSAITQEYKEYCNSQPEILTLVLPESQKVLIRNTWCHLETDMRNIGILVFLRIFDQSPKIKDLFPFRDSWGDDLLSHPMFRNHVYRYAYSQIEGAKTVIGSQKVEINS